MSVLPVLGDRRLWGGGEIAAGVTLAAVAIPEAMGYTKIAGMPVVTGIYTVALPALAFALLGSSRHLIVGADSATAAILFAGLAGLAAPASPAYVGLAGAVALLAAVLLGIARLLRLGFLADFLSRTALIGFLSGVGVQVAVSQIPGMLGIDASGDVVSRLAHVAGGLGRLHAPTALLAVAVVVVVAGLERLDRRVPATLVAVAGAIVVTAAFHLDSSGVRTVGVIAGGLPPFGLPHAPTSEIPRLAGIAASIFVVVLAQSAATARSFAQRHHEDVAENRDLVALACAEAVAGLSATFPVNGSPTKTAVADSAGGRTQLTQVVASLAALIVLLVATAVLRWLPDAALAAIVFVIGVKLVDVRHLVELYRLRMDEFLVAAATLVVVVFAGVEQGIVVAVVLSVLDYVRRGYRPRDSVLSVGATPRAHLVPHPAVPGCESAPGVLVYRFDAVLFFANASHFQERLLALVEAAPHPVRRVVLDLSPVADIDYTAGRVFRAVVDDLISRGITVTVAHADAVRSLLDRYGITERIGAGNICAGVHAALGDAIAG